LIHPTAIIDSQALIAADVSIGAYSVIEGPVKIGARTIVESHCVINGHTTIGDDNHFFPFSSIGQAPQDKKYKNQPTQLVIGNRNIIREFCTLNRGTEQGGGVTRLGDDNWIMAYVHFAHDCLIGNNTIFANNAQLAGHVIVGDYAILGGFTAVHQFCKIGAHSMTAIGTTLLQDLPPYVTCAGNPAQPHGINSEGLRRRGFSNDAVMVIKRAYKLIYKNGLSLKEAQAQIQIMLNEHSELQILNQFIDDSKRGLVR